MNRSRIALFLLCSSASALVAQSASTNRHASSGNAPGVTITVDEADPSGPKKRKSTKAQETSPEKAAEEARKEKVHALLDRAHALTEQLTPKENWFVMMGLLEVASRDYQDRAVDWAIEMWTASKDLPDDTRPIAQNSVISTVARIDPDKALALLPLVDRSSDSNAMLPGMAAVTVFSEMRHKHGDKVIPELQKVARSMAKDGSYPYSAAASLISRGWRRDDSEENTTSETSASIFRDAFQAYQSAPAHTNDAAFAQFVAQTWRSAPRDQAVQAADTAARALLAGSSDSSFSGAVTIGEKKVQLQSQGDMMLVRLMPVLKELDPAMLAKVLEARPDFAGAENGRARPTGMFGSPQNMPAEMRQRFQQAQKRRETMRLARTDPDRALTTASTMTDAGDKATLLAETAAGMAKDSPDDAAKVLDQAQKVAADVKDQMAELRIVVSSAQASRRLNQPQRVRELMSRGFELGSQLIRKQMDEHPESNGQGEALGYMTTLVSFGVADDPDGVTGVIEAVPYPMAKAMLYTAAARSIQMNRWRSDETSMVGPPSGNGGSLPRRTGPPR